MWTEITASAGCLIIAIAVMFHALTATSPVTKPVVQAVFTELAQTSFSLSIYKEAEKAGAAIPSLNIICCENDKHGISSSCPAVC